MAFFSAQNVNDNPCRVSFGCLIPFYLNASKKRKKEQEAYE